MRFAAAFSVIVSAAFAVAQTTTMTMNTPTGVMQCLNSLLTWTGGTAPYQITVLPGGQPNATPLETLDSLNGTSVTWLCKQQANTQIFFRLRELASGTTVDSGTVTVQANPTGDASCLVAATGSSSAPGATTPAATTPSAPAATTSAPATSAPGTTPTTTPAGTNKPQSSNNSKTSSSAATSPTTQGGGAGQLQAPVALAGVAAFAMALFA